MSAETLLSRTLVTLTNHPANDTCPQFVRVVANPNFPINYLYVVICRHNLLFLILHFRYILCHILDRVLR